MGQIDLFEYYQYYIGILDTKFATVVKGDQKAPFLIATT